MKKFISLTLGNLVFSAQYDGEKFVTTQPPP